MRLCIYGGYAVHNPLIHTTMMHISVDKEIKGRVQRIVLYAVALFVVGAIGVGAQTPSVVFRNYASSQALVVCSSSVKDTGRCDFVADGTDDQNEINEAVNTALPAEGGKVFLTEGTFSINGVSGTYGGILINRSNVVLEGSGPGTFLKLTDGNTDKNIIRIKNGVSNVSVRDLRIDATRATQQHSQPSGQPFEANGIRAGATGAPVFNVVVERVRVENCRQLCIMLFGKGVVIRNNWVGSSHSDMVELLQGPGQIEDNYFEVIGKAGVVISTDAADDINIVGNTIRVPNGSSVGVAIRTWQGFARNNIQSNTILGEPGSKIEAALTLGTSESLVSGNIIKTYGYSDIRITEGKVLFSGNYVSNGKITIDNPQTSPVVVANNYFGAKPAINIVKGEALVINNTGQ